MRIIINSIPSSFLCPRTHTIEQHLERITYVSFHPAYSYYRYSFTINLLFTCYLHTSLISIPTYIMLYIVSMKSIFIHFQYVFRLVFAPSPHRTMSQRDVSPFFHPSQFQRGYLADVGGGRSIGLSVVVGCI